MSTTTTATPLVEVRGLHTFYGNSHVPHGVDLHIAPGETLALLGRNGVGKSTTIRALLGLTPPRSGEVRIRGENITGSAVRKVIRRGIGYVPEGRGMFPNLTVRESLVMAARPGLDGRRDWDLERVLATFPRLAERFSHLTGQPLGQRAADGRHRPRAADQPQLMILDEAAEVLAPLIRKEIWDVIRLIKASGIATLVVDKNVKVLLDLTDRWEAGLALLLAILRLLAGFFYLTQPPRVIERVLQDCDWSQPPARLEAPVQAPVSPPPEAVFDPALRQHQSELLHGIEQSQADMHFATQLALQSGERVSSSAESIQATRQSIGEVFNTLGEQPRRIGAIVGSIQRL